MPALSEPARTAGFPHTFSIGERDFLLDQAPFRIISGAMHYFRVHPAQWADRIEAARLMGLNTIETYVPWSDHQPRPGAAHFGGRLDLGRYLDLIAEAGMYAIVRPGPFICAEFDNGGLPAWLSALPGVGVRTFEPQYLAAVEEFFALALEVVAPRQVTRGGPVLMVQVENEYGAYGDDREYLEHVATLVKACDIDVPLFTCDQADPQMLARGGLPGVLKTATFGSRAAERLAVLREAQPIGPLMCAEFWNGWFDHWGAHHHTTSSAAAAAELDTLLAAGASVNIYMFHGGTNFGFTSGANDKGTYEPTTTSYDYDAPLAEDGTATAKYAALREVIARHAPVPAGLPPARVAAPTTTVRLDRVVTFPALVEAMATVTAHTDEPLSMDALEHFRGLALYRTTISLAAPAPLQIGEVRDRAIILLDGQPIAVLSRDHHETVALVPAVARGELAIVVEDQGRVNYGPRIGEPKGLVGPVILDGRPVTGWRSQPLSLDPETIAALATADGAAARAGVFAALGEFELDAPADLFLDPAGWTKGIAYVNGFHLGRYWSRGPQRTLYVPAPVTRAGRNELIMVELHGATSARITFVAEPDLGRLEA